MKTIEDAVIELGGKLQEKTTHILTTGAFWLGDKSGIGSVAESIFEDGEHYISETKTAHFAVNQSSWVVVCTAAEFEATAKRMGYINGYRWGKEYPTNGKRPELPDDLMVEVSGPFNDSFSGGIAVSRLDWSSKMFSFRVSDPRYKPVDEVIRGEPSIRSELNLPVDEQEYEPVIITGADIACGGGGGGFMPKAESYFPPKTPESDWHERGEFPPVAAECEVYIEQRDCWAKVKVLAVDGDYIVWRNGSDNKSYIGTHKDNIRPIRTEREKVFEAADSLIHDYQAGAEIRTEFLSVLYDAGMLVLPQDSGDTKD